MTRKTLHGCVTLFSICLLAGCSESDPTGGDTTGDTTGGDTTSTDTGPSPGAGCGASEKPDADQTISVPAGGRERFVVVHVPPEYDPATPSPLVLAYAFEGGSPSSMNQATGLTAAADAAGMVIAYPVGVEASFDAGKCCGKAWEDKIDDVAFTRDVLDALDKALCIDGKRVYATGLSVGAMMAYRLACEMPDRLAAIAPVAGAVHTEEACAPAKAVPVLAIHGTADEAVPYDGGQGNPPLAVTGDMMFASVEASLAPFLAANGCGDATEQTFQQGDATCDAWSACADGAAVERCKIDGGGHTWPSGNMPDIFGPTSTDLDASTRIMEFFAAHPGK